MRYYLISGETSGDQHAARLIQELKLMDPNAEFRGLGGDRSEEAGMHLYLHQKETSYMGFLEVLQNLRKIRSSFRKIKKDLKSFKPDHLILIDFPAFNLRIAPFAKRLGIPVHYYIAPKAWAWNKKRVHMMKKCIDHLYSILPFEPAFFQNHGINCVYVGNPSWNAISSFTPNPLFKKEHDIDGPVIALLPGSRQQEIRSILPVMLKTLEYFPDHKPLIAQAPGFDKSYYAQFGDNLNLIKGDMYNLLHHADAAMVTSGTATLETALLEIPQVVCYRTSKLTYTFAKLVIRLPYISLVNIILNKHAVKELIQQDLNQEELISELSSLLKNKERRSELAQDYRALKEILGDQDPATEIARQIIRS